ncbi:prolipoprotein diacylglyceryl transferase [Candidatus Woesearchaeota archaeon]|nr:prolipoprotein diacylglyceryl transferase [Candidatus Woesearchaeota archaeon]
MFVHNIDPVLLNLGPLEIRYYGIIYVLGFIILYLFVNHLVKKNNIKLTKDQVIDYIFWIAVGIVVGARLFYTIVYNPLYYLPRIWEILYIWQGGLSFHGGLIGAIIAVIIFCRRHMLDLLEMADITIIPVALALSLGRIANFLNGELVGIPSDLPWCVVFPNVDDICRHPSQIYASIKDMVLFIILWSVKDIKSISKRPGTLFGLFITLYAMFRFVVGFFRAPDPQLGYLLFGLTMGQLLNIIMFIIGIAWLYYINKYSR